MASGSLTLTLSTNPSPGTYTWRLLATNNTATAQPTPTPSSATPKQIAVTIKIDPSSDAITTLNVTVGGSKIPLYPEDFTTEGYTVNGTSGETLRFQVGAVTEYTFVRWDFSNHNPSTDNPLILSNVTEDFTITAKLVPASSP
jgi:hypothetical protein